MLIATDVIYHLTRARKRKSNEHTDGCNPVKTKPALIMPCLHLVNGATHSQKLIAPGHTVCEISERMQLPAVCRDPQSQKASPVVLYHGSYTLLKVGASPYQRYDPVEGHIQSILMSVYISLVLFGRVSMITPNLQPVCVHCYQTSQAKYWKHIRISSLLYVNHQLS
jgi:hypothetical protein